VAKNWIKGAVKHPGALTTKAKAAGKSVSAFVAHPPKNASAQTKRQIALAKTLKGFHGHKK
jgi:hypothetical protein